MTTQIAPMAVSGIQHLVERAYRESGEHQYLRELLVNALEASATRVEFGPEWGAVEREGVYRLMVADDGCGMNGDQLLKFLNTFGGGGKPIGEAHENYGVGAKTSLVPWNRYGMVVLSWTTESPAGSMLWLMHDEASGEYGARKFETEDGDFVEVVEPHGEWAQLKPDWIEDHGTVVVCLGNTGKEDTFLGKDGHGEVKEISAYLNKRVWEVPAGVGTFVQELRSGKRPSWPRSLAEATASETVDGVDRRWNRRRIRAAKHFATEATTSGSSETPSKGTVGLQDGTEIDWFLWREDRPQVHSYAHKNGYIAALYRNELYDTQQHIAQFRAFGVTQSDVRAKLTLIARPPQTDGSYGVYPDTARNALKIQGTKRAGEPLPWMDWAQEFAENMPQEISDALAKAGPSRSGTVLDSSWRSRLTDRFGDRWKTLRYSVAKKGTHLITPNDAPGGKGGTGGTKKGPNTPPNPQPEPRKPSPSPRQVPGVIGGTGEPTSATTTSPSGEAKAKAVTQRGGLPKYDWVTTEEIDESGSFAAAWCRPSKDQPHGLVQLARDFAMFTEVKKYWRDQYPDHLGERIDEIIEEVYGEAMVARLAHSESLLADPKWGRARVESQLRTPAALTMSVLGLLSEDTVINNRLRGLGVRRKAA